MGLDRGEISFEGGLTLKKWPALTFKYSHLWREGDKSSTIWGQTHPGFDSGTPYSARGLVPSFYDIDEHRDIFELNAKQKIKTTDVGLGVRYEHGDLDDDRKISQWPGEGAAAGESKITDRSHTTYDQFNVNTTTETWLKKNLFLTTGFMFVNLDSDFSGSRIYGSGYDAAYTPSPTYGAGYTNLNGSGHRHEYMMNMNLMSIPYKHLTITPSLRVQRVDWDADSTTFQTFGNGSGSFNGFLDNNSDADSIDVRERLDARYNGITNWVLYVQGEWTEGQGGLNENGGSYIGAPIYRDTDDTRFFQKYSAGARWYPLRKVTVDFGGYYKLNHYDWDHNYDNTPNDSSSLNRYPAYLVMQDFETYDGNVRLTVRPRPNLTLISRYEYQLATINAKPDSASGLSEVTSSRTTSHIVGHSASWAPISRLYLQTGFDYVLSETRTPTSDYTDAVLDAKNDYWTVNFNSGLVLDNKTDLNVGYTYFRADNYQDNSYAGVPYGAGAEEHAVTATIVRRISERLRLTLRYGYFHSTDDPSGGHNDYDAHLVYSSLQYRF